MQIKLANMALFHFVPYDITFNILYERMKIYLINKSTQVKMSIK